MLKIEDIFEDVVAAPSAGAEASSANASAEVAAPTHSNDDADIVDNAGTTDADVLGKDCDHNKNGYLGPGCFHMPLFATAKGKKANNKKKKKKSKNPYEKGMAIITDADEQNLPKNVLSKIEKLTNDDIKKILKTSFQTNIDDDNQLDCIVHCPLDQKMYLKFIDGKKTSFVMLEFRDGKLIAQDLRIYTPIELERAYKSLKKPGTANQKLNIKDITLDVVWRRQNG